MDSNGRSKEYEDYDDPRYLNTRGGGGGSGNPHYYSKRNQPHSNDYRYHGGRRNAITAQTQYKFVKGGGVKSSAPHVQMKKYPNRVTTFKKLKWKDQLEAAKSVLDDDISMRNETSSTAQTTKSESRPLDVKQRLGRFRNDAHAPLQQIRRTIQNRDRVLGTSSAPGTSAGSTFSRQLRIGEANDKEIKKLSESKDHCKLKTIDPNVFDLIVKFSNQYVMCYDKNREGLLEAYHPKATFSLSLNVNSQAASTHHSAKFGSYFKDSRNLKYVMGAEKLYKILYRTNTEIVSFLSKMPASEHDMTSLKLDTCFFMQNLLTFSISGVLREGKAEDKFRPFRSFQRVFCCVPTPNGQMVIVNEQLTMSNLSIQQSKKYKEKHEEPSVSKAVDQSKLDESEKLKESMIAEFSRWSNLNLIWSRDCLKYADWNYEQAKQAFSEHRNEIPQEAFLKV